MRRGPKTGRTAIRSSLERLLNATNPISGEYEFYQSLAIGLLHRSRRLVRALLILDGSRTGDAGEGLVRAVLEDAITTAWLEGSPEERADRIIESYRRDYRSLEQEGLDDDLLTPGERDWLSLGESRKLPSLQERATTAGMEEFYAHYRLLSMQTHATAVAAATGLRGGPVSKNLPLAYLVLAGGALASLGRIVARLCGWSIEARLVDALQALNAAYRPSV
jgi:hypothetical protein